jgi:2-polyprenyl-6-methoxyphenol hydroxylase-like FAD-dependent oxidoreductase
MRDPRQAPETISASERTRPAAGYDAAIVGASLAGCTTAIMLARAGARVALIEQRPEASAYKRICSHYIQSSAVATLERLGLLEPMVQAGAVRSRLRIWTRWGWIEPAAKPSVPSGVNLRREVLDPLIRRLAAVRTRDREGFRQDVLATLVVGADGRGSRVAKFAGVPRKTVPHGRIAYGGYFEGPPPAGAPDASIWFLDPDWVAAFPTDQGLTFYACMPTKQRIGEFRGDPLGAVQAVVARVPEPPPIRASRPVAPDEGAAVMGKIDMTNVAHTPTAPGLALVGDAALAIDPLWGVGCGWAFQSGEWLAQSVAPALLGGEPLEAGLKRYRRQHARALRGHAAMIHDYAGGRKLKRAERLLFSAATYDERVARVFEAFGTRNIGPGRMLATGTPLALAAHARRLASRRHRSPVPATAVPTGASLGAAGRAPTSGGAPYAAR